MCIVTKHSYSEHSQQNIPSPRQGTTSSSLQNPMIVAASLAGFFLSNLFSIKSNPKPKLENHPMCGITSGGREECYYDCELGPYPAALGEHYYDCNLAYGVYVTNPTCLQDCDQIDQCVPALLRDVISSGMCYDPFDPSLNIPSDLSGYNPFVDLDINGNKKCKFEDDDNVYSGTVEGTCSEKTEQLLRTNSCSQAIFEQPGYLRRTLSILIRASCSKDVSDEYPYILFEPRQDLNYRQERQNRCFNETRLAPVEENSRYKTALMFEHTRHRYSWVCSLRSKDSSRQHLCAVTLLSIPPAPTVVVGPAHCTYLCKKSERNPVPSCCCGEGPDNCSDDKIKCGDRPQVYLMTPEDADILCGEWETGPVPSMLSGELYNVLLPIQEIVRHPNFNIRRGGGPINGSDIAIFKVDDIGIDRYRASSLKLRPACLPLEKRKTRHGIHTGWSRPPPYYIVQKYAPAYIKFYRDFSKQWHFAMDILEKCEDPQVYPYSTDPLPNPSNTYYPAGLVCAKDRTRKSCFSQGDSGSPLMVREMSRPQRFYVEGILSFVKGCRTFTLGPGGLDQFSDNPTAYTKLSCFLPWIADQYGMEFQQTEPEDECFQGSGDPSDGENKPCTAIHSPNECIFPFYYNNKLYTECIVITIFNWIHLPRCPVRNITTKINGINSYSDDNAVFGIIYLNTDNEDGSYGVGYCPTDVSDRTSPLDPSIQNCTNSQRRFPLYQCNNNCPGVRAFGIIGGGAVLAATAGVGAISLLGPAAGIGAVGALGLAGTTAMAMCIGPLFCRAADGKCCLLVVTSFGGLACPLDC